MNYKNNNNKLAGKNNPGQPFNRKAFLHIIVNRLDQDQIDLSNRDKPCLLFESD